MAYVDTHIRVRYAETDAMGIAHHASYIVWLEVGRTELLRARGMAYRALEEQGFLVVLSDLEVRYHASARYDDAVIVRATLGDIRSRQISFHYQLLLADTHTPLVTAQTTHIVLDRATRRATRLPKVLLELLSPDPHT